MNYLVLVCVIVIGFGSAAFAANSSLLSRPRDGSRAEAVHNIYLLDSDDDRIVPGDLHPEPFSTRRTCGQCHDYQKIRHGWHFGGPSLTLGLLHETTTTQVGRPGEPWILSDAATATALPVSERGWPGAWRPEQIGLTPWVFAKAFASHLPGGGVGDFCGTGVSPVIQTMGETPMPQELLDDPDARWRQAGALEIDCLVCHAGSPREDMAERAAQLASGNFRWAAAAASGMAVAEGSVESLPPYYDLSQGASPDDPQIRPPAVRYNPAIFDSAGKVFFDIKARPADNRCLFCHSTSRVGEAPAMSDRDVHTAAGLACVDCHRNDIDHQIIRGGEKDPNPQSAIRNPQSAPLTCRGCHLGDEASGAPAGRLRAPRPRHAGLPPVHLEKLSCTACHSGPAPEAQAGLVRTARAHKLGTRKTDDAEMPLIAAPVFVNINGTIQPCDMVWPSFWGTVKSGRVMPLLPGKVLAAAGGILATSATKGVLNEKTVARTLAALAKSDPGAGEPVYVSGGKVHKMGIEETLTAAANDAGRPCAWPIAHDVRPKAQALGARGCTDCHAPGAPFFFGEIAVADPLAGGTPAMVKMCELEGQDPGAAWLLGRSFALREWFKGFGFAGCGLILGVFMWSAAGWRRFGTPDSRARGQAPAIQSEGKPTHSTLIRLSHCGIWAGTLVLAMTGFGAPWLDGGSRLGGLPLLIHMSVAGVFIAALAGGALFYERGRGRAPSDFRKRLLFWCILGLGLITIGSMLASMTKLLESKELNSMVALHRWSALALLAALVTHGKLRSKN